MKLVSYLISTSVSELTKLPLQRVEAVTCVQNMSFKLDFASDVEIRRLTNLANLANKSKSHDLAGVWLRRRWREEKSAGRRRRRPQKRANYSTWGSLVNKDNVLFGFSFSWIHCGHKHIFYREQARSPVQKGLIFNWNHKLGVGVAEGPSRYGKSRSWWFLGGNPSISNENSEKFNCWGESFIANKICTSLLFRNKHLNQRGNARQCDINPIKSSKLATADKQNSHLKTGGLLPRELVHNAVHIFHSSGRSNRCCWSCKQ